MFGGYTESGDGRTITARSLAKVAWRNGIRSRRDGLRTGEPGEIGRQMPKVFQAPRVNGVRIARWLRSQAEGVRR